MEAKELREFSIDELQTRVKQWKEELFRSKFKSEATEAKDTSVFRKLRRDIARGLTILNEKQRAGLTPAKGKLKATTAAVEAPEAAEDKVVEDKRRRRPRAKKRLRSDGNYATGSGSKIREAR
jgi:large subunit ribosomal protein L29